MILLEEWVMEKYSGDPEINRKRYERVYNLMTGAVEEFSRNRQGSFHNRKNQYFTFEKCAMPNWEKLMEFMPRNVQ